MQTCMRAMGSRRKSSGAWGDQLCACLQHSSSDGGPARRARVFSCYRHMGLPVCCCSSFWRQNLRRKSCTFASFMPGTPMACWN